jgi:pimeloyl-ACP methyl ester carboxylesterase
MAEKPTLLFIPGAWHKPQCYDKIINLLQNEHSFKCISITLSSTSDNPEATFRDDIDVARNVILSETTAGRDVIVIAHSYGGMVGNSCIKGLTRPDPNTNHSTSPKGYVIALVLIASGFTITGLAFMDPLFGIPPPFWRVNKETGFAELTTDNRKLFYHDLPREEGEYWVSQLTTQSLKALFEGGEHAYAGWKDVPTWYIGTVEDKGLPVVIQRIQVGAARGQGGVVHHMELPTSHSPFLSMPAEVVASILQAAKAVGGSQQRVDMDADLKSFELPEVRVLGPRTWIRFGVPLAIGRVLGWGAWSYYGLKKLFT